MARQTEVPVGVIIGGCAFAYAIFFLLVTTSFDTNDDVSMMLMSVGFLDGGNASPHWPFTSLLIAKPVTALYQVWPGLPWYALYLYIAHFVAVCVLVFVALRGLVAFPRTSLFVCLAALVALELLMLTRVQFTSVGFTLAIAAIALWVQACMRNSSLVQVLLAGVLFGLAYNIRTQSAAGALLVMLPVVLLALVPALRKHQFAVLLVFPVAIAICAMKPVLADLEYGDDEAWQSYTAYNDLRGKLHLTPKLESGDGELDEVIATVGWSPVDLYMFKNWFFTDLDVFSQKSLEGILDARKWVVDSAVRKNPVAIVWSHVNENYYLLVLVTALALALCQCRRAGFYYSVFLLWGLGLMVYLMLMVRYPDRVSVSIALCLCVGLWLIAMLTAGTIAPRRPHGLVRGVRGVAIAIAFILLVQYLLGARDDNDAYSKDRVEIVAFLEGLARVGEASSARQSIGGARKCSPLFVNWAGIVPLELLSPWVTKADLPDIDILGLGSRTHSPPFNAFLKRCGIERLPPAIFQRGDVLLIANTEHYPVLINYIREHYDLEGQIEPLDSELSWKGEPVRFLARGVLGDVTSGGSTSRSSCCS